MPASRDYTAIDLYRRAIGPLDVSPNNVAYVERFVLANEALDAVVGLFYDLVESVYMRSATVLAGGAAGNYSTGGSIAWTAATSTLSGATMNVPFSSATHTGWIIMFRNAGNVYIGTISQVLSTTSVVIAGSNLPTSDIAAGSVADVLCSATPPTGNSFSLTGLRVMRVGQQVKFQLESTATTQIEFTNEQGIFTFRTNSKPNAILWAVSGDNILLQKGANISSYGTLTLRYPGVPTRMVQDSSPVDCADAIPIELLILKNRILIARRLKMQLPDYTQEMISLIQQIYVASDRQISSEVLANKAAILKG